MSGKVKIGVLGAGGIANSMHLPSLMEIEDCDLVAICDLREERAMEAAKKYHIPHVYSSQYEMMKNEQLDGVLVLVDCDRTFRAASECLENGWNVLLEKPAGITAYQAESLVRVAKKSGKICAVAMNRRHIPLVQYVIDKMREITTITQVDGVYIKNSNISDTWTYASAYMCDVVHAADMVRYLAGSEVKDAATIIARNNSPVDNAWSSVMRFENGVIGTLRANYQTAGRVHTFEIHGPGASAFINLGFGDAACDAKILYFNGHQMYSLAASGANKSRIDRIDGRDIAGGQAYYQYYGYKQEDIDFIRCIQTGQKPLCTIEDAANSMKMVEKLLSSAV